MSPARCLFPNNATTLSAAENTTLNLVAENWFNEHTGIHYYSVKYEYVEFFAT
jgi:hypothetical protein